MLKPLRLTTDPRYTNLDYLRILAALGIVWFHTLDAPARDVAYAGLPIFLLMSVAFMSMKPDVVSWWPYVKKQSSRLLAPWLFWSVFYLAVKLWHSSTNSESILGSLSPGMIVGGTSGHLWYLTFCFTASLVIWFLVRQTRSLPLELIISIAVVSGCTLLWHQSIITQYLQLGFPWQQWFYAMPAIPIGFAIGRSQLIPEKLQKWRVLAVSVLASISVCVLLWSTEQCSTAVSYAVAITLVSGGFVLPQTNKFVVAFLPSLTLGVYVMHPFIQDIVFKFSQNHISPMLRVLLVFVGACIFTVGLKQIPWLKRFV